APQPEVGDRTKLHQRRARPLLLVGHHQRSSMPLDRGIGLVVKPRLMAKLASCARLQRLEQRIQQGDISLPRRWKLQQDRAKPRAQRLHALREDAGETDAIEAL